MIPYIFDLKHLKKVGETWWEHFYWCMYSNVVFIILLVVGTIHGLFPFLLPDLPDKIVMHWKNKFSERRKRTGRE